VRRGLALVAMVGVLTVARPTFDAAGASTVDILGMQIEEQDAPAVHAFLKERALASGAVEIDGELVPWAMDLHDWQRLALCESGGDWHIQSRPFRGGLQFLSSSWRGVGGQGDPAEASVAEQIERARMLLDSQGPRAWPVCSRVIGWAA